MGRHETFENATPIADELLASTMLAGASAVASNDPARDSTSTLALIAEHRLARNRWDDTLKPADKVWRKQRVLDTSTEAVAAAEAERDAADDAVTKAWNNLFATLPASSAELLALLRHAQHYVDDDHAPDAAIELSDMVGAIGDAVETLRSQPHPEFGTETGATSPDRFLTDLAPTLLPLLDEVDAEWVKVQALYKQAEAACPNEPGPNASEATYKAFRSQFDVALVATGYKAAWEAIQPLFERIEALVGPLMNVPVQTLEGLILKQRIGQTLEHFEDDAASDLAKLAKAYRPGEPIPRSAQVSIPPRFHSGIINEIDLASATMDELRSIRDVAERIGSVAYAHAWSPRCQRSVNAYGAPNFNAVGRLVQWIGDTLTEVEGAAEKEAKRRVPSNREDRETRLSMLAVTTIDNGDLDETEALARDLLIHVRAEREGR